jgi:hypothetical protein
MYCQTYNVHFKDIIVKLINFIDIKKFNFENKLF